LRRGGREVEDYAVATLELEGDIAARIACSWRLNAGQDAEISVSAYGQSGGIRFANVGGSFYDFLTEHLSGTQRTPIVAPPEDWGGRAAADWVRRVHAGERFDPTIEDAVHRTDP
jgi:predicted dehydrogenase